MQSFVDLSVEALPVNDETNDYDGNSKKRHSILAVVIAEEMQ